MKPTNLQLPHGVVRVLRADERSHVVGRDLAWDDVLGGGVHARPSCAGEAVCHVWSLKCFCCCFSGLMLGHLKQTLNTALLTVPCHFLTCSCVEMQAHKLQEVLMPQPSRTHCRSYRPCGWSRSSSTTRGGLWASCSHGWSQCAPYSTSWVPFT